MLTAGARASRRARRAVALALLGGVLPACAQVYSSASGDPSATVVLSNFASEQTPLLVVDAPGEPAQPVPPAPRQAAPAAPVRAPPPGKPTPAIGALIADIARQVDISPALLHAVIARESNFDPNAVSPKGALGLMQLLPQTAQRFGARRPLDPGENIRAGAMYLRWLSTLFDGDLALVLAAYNAGEQAVIRAGWRIPDYAETKSYVARIAATLSCRGLAICSAVTPNS